MPERDPCPRAEPRGSIRRWALPIDIRAVFVDAGNTMLFIDFERVCEAIREGGHLVEPARLEEAEQVAHRRADDAYRDGLHRDREMWVLYFTWLLHSAGVPDAIQPEILERLRRMNEDRSLWARTKPAIRVALATLRKSGRVLAVISNSDGSCRDLLRQTHLLDFFDAVYDSAEIGVEKPDAAIFERALSDLGLKANETLHVGDLESVDVLGARRAGILPVLIHPRPESLTREFPVLRSLVELPAALEIEP